MATGDRLRIRVGGRPTKSGGGSTDGDWEDWLLGRLMRGGYPDGGEGVTQELTVRWGYAYPGTGPVWLRTIPWRCNGAGGATRVWLTPLDGEERLIIVEPGAGASPHPRYRGDGGGAPMDAYPEGAWGVGDFPFDRQTWAPPSPFDDDQSLAWPPVGAVQGAPHFRYAYGWCGNVGAGGPFDEFPDPDPPEAWFGWEQDMTTYRAGLFGTSLEQPSWPVSDLGAYIWADDTPGGDNFHDDVGPGDPMPDPPGPGEQPRRPRDEVPVKVLDSDLYPPANEERETRFGETSWEEQGGNGEPSAFGPRCPGGGGWGGGAAGNTTRRQVSADDSGGWVSWIRMGQGTGKTGGRWWNTSVVETVIRGDGTVLWGTDGLWLYNRVPYWIPAPTELAPEGYDYCWPESAGGYLYELDGDEEWGRWVRGNPALDGPFPYLANPDYDGYVGMGAAWVCAERAGAEPGWAIRQIAVGRLAGVSTNLAGIVGAAVGE